MLSSERQCLAWKPSGQSANSYFSRGPWTLSASSSTSCRTWQLVHAGNSGWPCWGKRQGYPRRSKSWLAWPSSRRCPCSCTSRSSGMTSAPSEACASWALAAASASSSAPQTSGTRRSAATSASSTSPVSRSSAAPSWVRRPRRRWPAAGRRATWGSCSASSGSSPPSPRRPRPRRPSGAPRRAPQRPWGPRSLAGRPLRAEARPGRAGSASCVWPGTPGRSSSPQSLPPPGVGPGTSARVWPRRLALRSNGACPWRPRRPPPPTAAACSRSWPRNPPQRRRARRRGPANARGPAQTPQQTPYELR
mmetsp:Transcript_34639/g.107779  ORF Transcript_34639/g.107779 Transcript_34639/m.107779 type:complete len:306 (-) Transcript_34639:63-980(-)